MVGYVVTRVVLQHVAGAGCWCRPRWSDDGVAYGCDEWVWVHRKVSLLPDVQDRAFQSVNLGPPV